MADSVIPKNIDARLSLTGELMDSIQFASAWIQLNPNGWSFRLADGESLETHLRDRRKSANKSALQFLDEIDRVQMFNTELRERLDALDIADPGGIPERRDLRGLQISARESYRLLVDGSSDPARTHRAPTVSLQSNRTPDELDALADKLEIRYRELRAYSLQPVQSLTAPEAHAPTDCTGKLTLVISPKHEAMLDAASRGMQEAFARMAEVNHKIQTPIYISPQERVEEKPGSGVKADEQSNEPTVDAKPEKPESVAFDGCVTSPSDPTAYTESKALDWRDIRTDKRIVWLRNYTTNKVRWFRPLNKTGRPTGNRLRVHEADFNKRWRELEQAEGDDPAEIERRTAEIRARK